MRMKKTILVELMILVMLLQGCSLTNKNSGIETNSNLNDIAALKNENEALKEQKDELSAKLSLLENKNSGIEADSNLNDIAALRSENEVLKERNVELSAKVTLLENKTKDIEELQERVSVLSSEMDQLLSYADADEVAGSTGLLAPSLLLDYAYSVLALYSTKSPGATYNKYNDLTKQSPVQKKNSNVRAFIDRSLDYLGGAYTEAYIELPNGLNYKSFSRTTSSQHGIYTYSSTAVYNVYWNQEYVRVESFSASAEVKQIDTLEVFMTDDGLIIHRFSDYRDEYAKKDGELYDGNNGCLFYYDFTTSRLSFLDFTDDVNWNGTDVRNLIFDYVFDFEYGPERIFYRR